MFKDLKRPEQEGRNSIHNGKWFVFIDDDYGKYVEDRLNFLHIQQNRLCKLEPLDSDNDHIMFDTLEDAFFHSVEFYVYHGKEFDYPWVDEWKAAMRGSVTNNVESQAMRFE